MGNIIGKIDSIRQPGAHVKYSKTEVNDVATISFDNDSDSACAFEFPQNTYYEYMPFLDSQYWLSRATTLLCYGHQYEFQKQYELALKAFSHAVDVLYFISKHCLKNGNENIDKVRKQTVIAIRKVIFLRSIVAGLTQKSVELKLNPKTNFKRPTSDEAIEQLLLSVPDYDENFIRHLNQILIMEVQHVQFQDVVGLQHAKIAMKEELVHLTKYTQEITYKLIQQLTQFCIVIGIKNKYFISVTWYSFTSIHISILMYG